MISISLDRLVGKHVLSTACVFSMETKIDRYCTDDYGVMSIGIDGNTYTFIEDPSDGYRSYLQDIEMIPGLSNDRLKGATIINRDVWINHITKHKNHCGECDLIQIIDMETGHEWARLGTDNIDDYYPGCVMEWYAMNPDDYKNAVPIREMKEIPISAAKAIAEVYGYDQVVVYARRVGEYPMPFGEHMTTYGVNEGHCAVAAKMGDTLKTFMKWDVTNQ